ncbi:hypothetical protein DPMN_120404 [Dreissena polymorpha]|uniref:Uncharacterized protein n=1 Tax=Dreissena polymorpha TaxID=45954 RepID=A0A9D4GKS5_DREPO|nr:hypothetical protein DPMN_120404 [Dreissena polymorpha]
MLIFQPGSPSFSSLSGPKNGTAVGYQNVYNPPPDTVIHLKEPIVNYIGETMFTQTVTTYPFT